MKRKLQLIGTIIALGLVASIASQANVASAAAKPELVRTDGGISIGLPVRTGPAWVEFDLNGETHHLEAPGISNMVLSASWDLPEQQAPSVAIGSDPACPANADVNLVVSLTFQANTGGSLSASLSYTESYADGHTQQVTKDLDVGIPASSTPVSRYIRLCTGA